MLCKYIQISIPQRSFQKKKSIPQKYDVFEKSISSDSNKFKWYVN